MRCGPRQPALVPALRLHHHQRPGRRIQEVLQHAQLRTLGIAHSEARQVFAVILPGCGSRQLDALDQDLAVTQLQRAIAIGYAFLRVGSSGPTWDLGDKVGDLESLSVTVVSKSLT